MRKTGNGEVGVCKLSSYEYNWQRKTSGTYELEARP